MAEKGKTWQSYLRKRVKEVEAALRNAQSYASKEFYRGQLKAYHDAWGVVENLPDEEGD